MTYTVRITEPALRRIHEQASYIVNEQRAPEVAARWLERVLNAGDTLGEMPRRCPRALEDVLFQYEIRAMLVGQFVLLFTVAEDTKTVWIISARHGPRLPRPEELPLDPDTFEDGSATNET